MSEFMIDTDLRAATGLCSSRGPRIGDEDSTPRCRLPVSHDGDHKPAPEDGWGPMTWTDAGVAFVTGRVPAQGAEETCRHNHFTRDIKPRGVCPRCDAIRAAWETAAREGR